MSFNYQDSTVYFRDKFVPFIDANLSIGSAPVTYGLSIYTVFPVCWNETTGKLNVFRLRDHYNRLLNSARIVDFHSFPKEWSYKKFQETMFELLKKNNLKEDVLVRVSVFIDEIMSGTRMHDLNNSLSAFVYPVSQLLPKDGASVCVSSWQRTSDNAIPSRAKVNGSYINASLMKNEALLNGYDDAISLDEHGHVAEGTVANFFMVRDGTLITPDSSTDILEGITRDSVRKVAKQLGIPTVARSIDRSELYLADEAFLSGSSVNISPITSIDKRKVGDGQVGEVTKQLGKTYQDALHGKEQVFSSWLTEV